MKMLVKGVSYWKLTCLCVLYSSLCVLSIQNSIYC